MVLLLQKLGHSFQHHSKLENHHLFHHHRSDASPPSLEAFRSHVSNSFNQLLSNSKLGSESLSLSWIQQCFEFFSIMNKAFTKLVLDIEYPFSKWEDNSVEEYLNYSLSLLELLNSISSSISQLGQSRISLSYALSIVKNSPFLAIEKLKPIEPASSFNKNMIQENKGTKGFQEGKQLVIHQALIVVKSFGFCVCGIILSTLSCDHNQYVELKELAKGFENSSACEAISAKSGVLKEVKEVNDAVICLAESLNSAKINEKAEELRKRLVILEKMVECVGKEVDHLFVEVLAGRNELLNILRKQIK